MDFMIREYAKNCSDTYVEPYGVDEERTVYQFDQINLNKFVNQVIERTKELTEKAY